MTIKERINKLKEDNYYVSSESFGKTKLLDGKDLIRIIKNNDICNPIQSINMNSNMDLMVRDELLDNIILNEDVWTCHGVLVLDLNIAN